MVVFCTIPQNHKMAWIGRDLKDHKVSSPQLQAGFPAARSGTRSDWAQGPIQYSDAFLKTKNKKQNKNKQTNKQKKTKQSFAKCKTMLLSEGCSSG